MPYIFSRTKVIINEPFRLAAIIFASGEAAVSFFIAAVLRGQAHDALAQSTAGLPDNMAMLGVTIHYQAIIMNNAGLASALVGIGLVLAVVICIVDRFKPMPGGAFRTAPQLPRSTKR